MLKENDYRILGAVIKFNDYVVKLPGKKAVFYPKPSKRQNDFIKKHRENPVPWTMEQAIEILTEIVR
jgi:hypothetical protein